MENEEKEKLIGYYKTALENFNQLFDQVPGGALDYKPEKTYWTIREHIVHLLESEVYGFMRYRTAIARPGERVSEYNDELWKENLLYGRMKVEKCCKVINLLIEITIDQLNILIDHEWEKYVISHPERGVNTLPDLIEIRIQHLKSHMQYIKRNADLYNRLGKSST